MQPLTRKCGAIKMSDRSDIAAALAKLTEIKNTPRPPYFDRWNGTDFTYGNLDDAVCEGFEFGQNYGEWRGVQDTLDFQLSILDGGLFALNEIEALKSSYSWDDEDWTYRTIAIDVARQLSRAVNRGEA